MSVSSAARTSTPYGLTALIAPRRHARHARPSKVGPVIVAGGMTAAFAAVDTAALAGAASAGGSVAQFERLAQCESGGNWSINTGNGYYGGLQFNLATWRGVGFGGYPHQASKATQIAAGQKLQGQRGWSPWPACSRKLGLSGNGGNPGSGDPAAAAATRTAAKPAASRREAAARASRSTRATAAQAAAVAKASARAAAKNAAKAAARREAAAAAREARIAAILALEPTGAPVFDGRVLTVNDVGTYRIAVKHWQRRMAARGWSIAVDGHFGAQSAAVAKGFLADKNTGVPVDRALTTGPGTVDRQLWDLAWTTPVTV